MSVLLRNISDRSLAKTDVGAVEKELLTFADDFANEMLLDFELTTAFWEHQVKFEKLVEVRGGNIEILVGTDDEIYGYVNEGTRPHVIKPKAPGYPLSFMIGGKAKTTPKQIPSSKGVLGNIPVKAMVVHHPGTKAREFDKQIQKKYEKKFQNTAQKALDRAIKRAGLI